MGNTATFQKLHSRQVFAQVNLAAARLVTRDGTYTTDGTRVAGVTESAALAGRGATLTTGWSALVEAAGPIAAGALVAPALDGTGRAVESSVLSCGRALTSATGAGDTFELQLLLERPDLRQAGRKLLLRPVWLAVVAMLGPMQTFVPTTGTVVYVDPSSGTNGAGTFASPRNAWPTVVDNQTILIKERTRIVTTAIVTNIANTGVVIGTYDAATGERVLDKARLATIDGALSFNFRCVVKWLGTAGTFALSGVRLVGGNNASGGVQMFESNSATGVATVTVEHCVFEDMGTFGLVSSFINNQAVTVSGTARLVMRFCRTNVPADGVNYGGTAGCDIYGNEFVTPSNLANNGPDAVQVQRSGAVAMGHIRVWANWIDHVVNSKQGFILSGGTPQATGDFVWFVGNFLFGPDTGLFHALPPATDANPAIGLVCDSQSGTVCVGNYFDQFAGWAGVGSNSVLAYNVGVRDHSGPFFSGFGTNAGSSGSAVFNNTAIAGPAAQIGTDTAFELAGSGAHAVVRNNAAIGPWVRGMRIAAPATTEANSLFWQCLSNLVNGSAQPVALAGSSKVAEPLVDAVGRPYPGSPLLGAGAAVRDGAGMLLRYADPFGHISNAADAPNIGAGNALLA